MYDKIHYKWKKKKKKKKKFEGLQMLQISQINIIFNLPKKKKESGGPCRDLLIL